MDKLQFVYTSDRVDVVRCKDCKYLNAGENEVDAWYRCRIKKIDVDSDFYCADGERRDGE